MSDNTSKKIGRPKLYQTDEERKDAKRKQNLEAWRRYDQARKAKLEAYDALKKSIIGITTGIPVK